MYLLRSHVMFRLFYFSAELAETGFQRRRNNHIQPHTTQRPGKAADFGFWIQCQPGNGSAHALFLGAGHTQLGTSRASFPLLIFNLLRGGLHLEARRFTRRLSLGHDTTAVIFFSTFFLGYKRLFREGRRFPRFCFFSCLQSLWGKRRFNGLWDTKSRGETQRANNPLSFAPRPQ